MVCNFVSNGAHLFKIDMPGPWCWPVKSRSFGFGSYGNVEDAIAKKKTCYMLMLFFLIFFHDEFSPRVEVEEFLIFDDCCFDVSISLIKYFSRFFIALSNLFNTLNNYAASFGNGKEIYEWIISAIFFGIILVEIHPLNGFFVARVLKKILILSLKIWLWTQFC